MEAGKLPELVVMAIENAFQSNRNLSWKIQENKRGLLIQLVWKPATQSNRDVSPRMLSNWNLPAPRTRKSPSRLRRDALRRDKFGKDKHQSADEDGTTSNNTLTGNSSGPATSAKSGDCANSSGSTSNSLAGTDSSEFPGPATSAKSGDSVKSTGVKFVNATGPIVKEAERLTVAGCTQLSHSQHQVISISDQINPPSSDDQSVESTACVTIPESKPLSYSPVALHTRSHCKSAARGVPCLKLKLPDNLSCTQYHVDFVRCEEYDTAAIIRDCMQQQWSDIINPGLKVKVKVKDDHFSGVVKDVYFVAKLASNNLYFFATARAVISISDDENREFQLRDLILES